MPFRTLELSDPRFTHDGLRHVTFKSPSLRGRADVTLFVPDRLEPNTPLVTLLHGVYGSHWAWALKAGVHLTAARLISTNQIPPMVLAMPSDGLWGDGSGYVYHPPPARGSANFEYYVAREVPDVVQEVIPSVTAASPRFIAGLSMGGFGALRIGAKYGREYFTAVAGHSAITHFSQMANFVQEPLVDYGQIPLEEQSVLATILAHRHKLPPMRFDCGVDDALLNDNRELHIALDAAGIAHGYLEFPGAHEWPYWAQHIESTLIWFGSMVDR
jgi:S-formylglutathione hydrolase FrmB